MKLQQVSKLPGWCTSCLGPSFPVCEKGSIRGHRDQLSPHAHLPGSVLWSISLPFSFSSHLETKMCPCQESHSPKVHFSQWGSCSQFHKNTSPPTYTFSTAIWNLELDLRLKGTTCCPCFFWNLSPNLYLNRPGCRQSSLRSWMIITILTVAIYWLSLAGSVLTKPLGDSSAQ